MSTPAIATRPASAQEKALWQLGLDWLREINGAAMHPLDRRRVRRLARGMRMVGESPSYSDVSAYIGELWRGCPRAASIVRGYWRSVYRAQTSLGRDSHWHCTPLYQPDRLIERFGLHPLTEQRLAAVTHSAVDALLQAAEENDTTSYVRRKRELDAALTAVQHLRFLRHGSSGLAFEDPDAEAPRRPRWW